MPHAYHPGDLVQTPFGKGTLRELGNSGRVTVDVRGRSMIFDEAEISPVEERKRRSPARHAASAESLGDRVSRPRIDAPSEVDLHGLTVEQALLRAEEALNAAMLADRSGLRFIHGRSSARIRDALHRWLGAVASVRGFRIDPQNAGVTIVQL